jgi:hypothetical protein
MDIHSDARCHQAQLDEPLVNLIFIKESSVCIPVWDQNHDLYCAVVHLRHISGIDEKDLTR